VSLRVLLVEDERPALERLEAALRRWSPAVEIVDRCDRVETAVAFLRAQPSPDLILTDIQLADGLSFEIFERVPVDCPAIFVTAYDAYLLDAFRHNGIDYILKPVSDADVAGALDRYRQLREHFAGRLGALTTFLRTSPGHRERVLVRRGADVVPVPVERIAYVRADRKLAVLVEKDGRESLLERSLNELQAELDPSRFFRANRQYLVHLDAVRSFRAWFKGRLCLDLVPPASEDVVVSAENAAAFRSWFDR
jgi:DNA-binding LytR/AlgR family response regulator